MFDNIILFTYLVEVGSYSKTAEVVRLSQSTLSKRIIELETALNIRLFIRDTRNLELTKDGLLVYQRYKNLRQSLKKTMADLSGKTPEVAGELRVQLPNIGQLITPFLGIYSQRNPKVTLNISYQMTAPDPEDCPFDIILSPYENIAIDGFHSYLVRQEFGSLYCSPAYAIKNGMPLTIEDLDNHQLIGLVNLTNNNVTTFIRFINKYTNEEVLYENLRCRIKMNTPQQIKMLGLTDDYIFGSWGYLCENDVINGRLIQVLPEYSVTSTKFHLCCRYKLTELEESFIDFIRQCLNRSFALCDTVARDLIT